VPEDAPFCLSAPGISSVQLGFGLLDLEALDQGTLAAAAARGLGIIARGCFGGGLLKDGLDEAQLKAGDTQMGTYPRPTFAQQEHGPLLAGYRFQFCRGTPAVSVTLLGMRVENHLRENLRYFQPLPLNAEEYMALRHLQKVEEELSEPEIFRIRD
jgi:aryl-alcohol dehydrogenase-like predicted oxidoreductase